MQPGCCKVSWFSVFVLRCLSGLVIPGSEMRNFPLDDCSTQTLDILGLYISDQEFDFFTYQQTTFNNFVLYLEETSLKRLRISQASVVDTFSLDNSNLNVSSWYFQTIDNLVPFAGDYYSLSVSDISTEEILLKKIKFVERLFSEMSGVRNNATHIAVIFLNGVSFSYEENQNIPHILQQQNTDIKIFVVVFGGKTVVELVHLNDTLLIPYSAIERYDGILRMAMCQDCRNDWFLFEHSHGTDSYSCYRFYDSDTKLGWSEYMDICSTNNGFLATIETKEELNFLRKQLSRSIKERASRVEGWNGMSQLSGQVYIGLQRDSTSVAKRFHWSLKQPTRLRPQIIDHWLDGKPSGRYNNAGTVWQFIWNDSKNGSNISNSEDNFVDGWSDCGIRIPVSILGLCEMSLPRRLEDKNVLRIAPATTASFNQALTKGKFIKFDDNIVSISTQIANSNFLPETDNQVIPVFDCGDDASYPRYIFYRQVCDYIDNCSNRRDELFCWMKLGKKLCPSNDDIYLPTRCFGVYCCDGRCLPVEWVNDGQIDCTACEYDSDKEVNDESDIFNVYLKNNETCALICNCGRCIHFSQLNDGYVDCEGPEGPLDETIGKLEASNTCYNVLGNSIWAPRCVFIKDRYGAVIGCRDMSHLQNCTDFECPEKYFKCPSSYCIPQYYVLDGHIDCPTGEEEQNYNIEPCIGNFACWNSKICLHLDLVCDGHPECPYEDDEVDCNVKCADGFQCVSGTVTISDYNRVISLDNLDFFDFRTKYLDLSGIDIFHFESVSSVSRFLVVCILSNCNIRNLKYFLIFSSLQKLDLSYNLIEIFDCANFFRPGSSLNNLRHLNLSYNKQLIFKNPGYLEYLEILDLSHTSVSYFDDNLFKLLPNIKDLYLRHTPMSDFNKNFFSSNLILQTFDLRGMRLNYREDMFNGLTISQNLYTDNFQICCQHIRGANIPYHVCHTPEDAISSCDDLVGAHIQRVLLWVVAVLAVLGNLSVIVYRVIWDRSVLRTGYGLFVTNLGISDFIMGVYLFIIAGADYSYRGVYILYDKNWREGNVCRLAGFLTTLSCETSTYLIFLITLDRFLIMKFPFGQIKFSNKSKMIALMLSWIICFLLALIPIVFKFEIYSSNAICLSLPLTTQRFNGWQYTFGVFIVHNFIMVVIIAYGQRTIFKAMSENSIANTDVNTNTSSRRTKDILVAKQLSLVALSNFLCWFTVGIMGVLSLVQHKISNDVYTWTAVFILPINSAANPILYTIPALIEKWEHFKSNFKRSI